MKFVWGREKGNLEEIGDLNFSIRLDGNIAKPYYHIPSAGIRGALREWTITNLLPRDQWDMEKYLKELPAGQDVPEMMQNIISLFGFAVSTPDKEITRKSIDQEFVKEFDIKVQRMDGIIDEIRELGDEPHAVIRGKLFSIEGRSAAAYWDTVKTLLDEMIIFEGRVGQGASDLVNSLLNYGYGIIYGKVWNAVTRAGLSPYISFLHVPQAGKPTLIFDLIEEFRPQAVDRVVYSMINKRVELKMDGKMLSADTRSRLAAEVLERVNTVERFRGREMRLYEIIQEQARNVASYLVGDLETYTPYVAKW